jgi:hypothetical protein
MFGLLPHWGWRGGGFLSKGRKEYEKGPDSVAPVLHALLRS